MIKTCDCGNKFTEEQSSGTVCYPCKLGSFTVNWVGGGGYGREAFHGSTVREIQADTMAEASRKGIDAEPVPMRAELI